jgi:phosphatidylglycerophosphatase A
MAGFRKHIIFFLSTGAYSGYFPKMPGTAGSAAGIVFYLFLSLFNLPTYLTVTVLFIILSVWISGEAEKLYKKKDPPEVVIDEIVGYLITMATFPPEWKYIIAGFVLFRVFDILKPYPANRINEQGKGGYGIVFDDVVAGIYANLLLQAVRVLNL